MVFSFLQHFCLSKILVGVAGFEPATSRTPMAESEGFEPPHEFNRLTI